MAWGGFWTAAGQIKQKNDGLCRHRQQDVSLIGQQEEIWLKQHRLVSLKRLNNTLVFVVEPQAQGFQAIDFLRQNADLLHLVFVTPNSQEIARIEHTQLPKWKITYVESVTPPANLPLTGSYRLKMWFLGWGGLGIVLIVIGLLIKIKARNRKGA